MTDHEDNSLDLLFAAARANPPVLSGDRIALLEQQALDAQPFEPVWRRAVAVIGGLPGLGGLVASVVLGLWIGVASPDVIGLQVDALLGADSELLQSVDFGWEQDEG